MILHYLDELSPVHSKWLPQLSPELSHMRCWEVRGWIDWNIFACYSNVGIVIPRRVFLRSLSNSVRYSDCSVRILTNAHSNISDILDANAGVFNNGVTFLKRVSAIMNTNLMICLCELTQFSLFRKFFEGSNFYFLTIRLVHKSYPTYIIAKRRWSGSAYLWYIRIAPILIV